MNVNDCVFVSDLFILLELEDDENSQSLKIESSLIQLNNKIKTAQALSWPDCNHTPHSPTRNCLFHIPSLKKQ